MIIASLFRGLRLHSGLLIFTLCIDKSHNGYKNIWAPGFGVLHNAELNVPLENGACLIITSKVSIICNNTRTV